MFEVIEAVLNRAGLMSVIHPQNFESITILRALHETRYLKGVYDTKKDQLENMVKILNKIYWRNAISAREGRPPLVLQEVLELIKSHIGIGRQARLGEENQGKNLIGNGNNPNFTFPCI